MPENYALQFFVAITVRKTQRMEIVHKVIPCFCGKRICEKPALSLSKGLMDKRWGVMDESECEMFGLKISDAC